MYFSPVGFVKDVKSQGNFTAEWCYEIRREKRKYQDIQPSDSCIKIELPDIGKSKEYQYEAGNGVPYNFNNQSLILFFLDNPDRHSQSNLSLYWHYIYR